MREPRCTKIVPSKNLWEIAIEFISQIDDKLMDYNIKLAYITYIIAKKLKMPKRVISKLILIACFNNVGKLYERDEISNSKIETYLFLKYFTPVKNYAEILLIGEKNIKIPLVYETGIIYKLACDFTTNLLKTNNSSDAIKLLSDKLYVNYVNLLEHITKKVDFTYELDSMHYKTLIYQNISKLILSSKEKNQFITMLSSLFEMYSVQTLNHSKMTALLAYKIAKCMKLDSKRCKKIYVAGLCHDLGKVCIPLKILEKPDKLTDKEFDKMKKHVTYTKQILNSKLDYEIIEMAYRHHEKIDGSGYPNKITGNHLTIDQKILQVADIISALIAKRSYKEAWGIEKTIAILDENVTNCKLDKEIVDCFKLNQKKILKSTKEFTESAEKLYDKVNLERQALTTKNKEKNDNINN